MVSLFERHEGCTLTCAMKTWRASTSVLIAFCVPALAVAALQSPFDFTHGSMAYTSAPLDDPISRLQERINSGETKLNFDPQHGYLESLLDSLNIPRTSQTLVFSKTSLQ